MFPGNTDAGRSDIAFQYAHSLDIIHDALEKGHGIIFDYVALAVDQQHTEVMGVKMLFILFIQSVHIFHDMRMGFLMFQDLFPGQTVDPGHGFMGQTEIPAALPGFRHPGMHVRVHDAVIHEFIIICR